MVSGPAVRSHWQYRSLRRKIPLALQFVHPTAQITLMDKIHGGDSSEILQLIERAARGDLALLGKLLHQHRDRLRRLVALRLDHRLQSRIDPSDVLQEAFLEASARLPEYIRAPTMPFFLWLRLITGQRLQILHRRHLGVQARDAGREISLSHRAMPEATSAALAAQLLGRDTRVSEIVSRAERKLRLQEALNCMDPLDREILALRHTERLTNAEAGEVLGISEAAAGQRHFRALKKLKAILADQPGGLEELRG
jgi:RNA polymerase sigma-70 factor (ECF subfamily)